MGQGLSRLIAEWDAEGEIRTPEGLAAHQISSLARWTELRYLSASPLPEM